MTTLWELKPHQSATVHTIQPHAEFQKLYALGLTPGVQITCLQTTAFKGPKVYQVMDQVLSLSQEVATQVQVSISPETGDSQ